MQNGEHHARPHAQDATEERAAACEDLRRALETEKQAWLEAQHSRATEQAAMLETRLREEANSHRDAEIKVSCAGFCAHVTMAQPLDLCSPTEGGLSLSEGVYS